MPAIPRRQTCTTPRTQPGADPPDRTGLCAFLRATACGSLRPPSMMAIVALIAAGTMYPAIVIAESPQPTLRMESGRAADTVEDAFEVTAGTPARFHLNLPGGERWTTANIGHFVVRTYGKQDSISPVPKAGADFVEHTFAQPGLAMVILASGPASEKSKRDSWHRTTHCTKLILRVKPNPSLPQAAPSIELDPGLTAKVGDKIEVLPLIAPTSLRAGHNLPVRVYFDGQSQKDAEVIAYRPDGSLQKATTDSVGTTVFDLTQPGRWIIRYATDRQSPAGEEVRRYVADLVFEVPKAAGEDGGER